MNADPSAQRRLLDVQALDSRADQLRHQREHLAETAVIAELTRSRADLEGRVRDQQMVVDDLAVAQRKADADVEQVRARRARDQDRIDQGLISNPRDLERMQQELVSLERRINDLEDAELEVMEQLENAERDLAELRNRLGDTEEQLERLTADRDRRTAEIDAQLAEVAADRGPAVEDLPEELLALYDRLRGTKGGVGAAELRARECGGCRLTLDHAELAEIRSAPADQVVRCEQCQRILVRTPESGL